MGPWKLLLVEDNANDVDLELFEFRRAGLPTAHRVVDSADGFVDALRSFAPDVILSDFSMPNFDGMEALRLARELAPYTPFIYVSGTLGEDAAISALNNGATDYVLKTNLLRLVPAVERALIDAEAMRERRRTAAELEMARERLQASEAGLRRAQQMAKLAHVITASDGSFQSWSETLPKLIGAAPASLPRNTGDWLHLVHPDDRELVRTKSVGLDRHAKRLELEYRTRHADGALIHLRQVTEPLSDQGEVRWFSTLQDITDQKRAEAKIGRLNRVYAVLSGINGLIMRVRDRGELYREACKIAVHIGGFKLSWIGLVDRHHMRVTPVAFAGAARGYVDLMPLSLEADVHRGLAGQAVTQKQPMIANGIANDSRVVLKQEAAARGFRSLVILPLIVADAAVGVLALYADVAGFFDDEEMKLLVELAGDISFALNHIEKSEKLDYLAYNDSLTGLGNRAVFLERLGQYITAAAETQSKLALILCDLRRFRAVNDSLGRQAGDLLLVKVAERLKAAVPDAKQLARLGTDQFAVVLPSISSDFQAARAMERLERVCLRDPFPLGKEELLVSASAGVAIFPDHGTSPDVLLGSAEAALAKARSTGERYVFFDPTMTLRVAANLSLENALRRALKRDEFVLHYQPRVEIATRRILGVEALLRWRKEGELVPPGKFIPLLEETGLILDVGAWVIRTAVLEHRAWVERGLRAPRIAVNVSALQLRQRDFVSRVKRALERGAAPPGIDLEITESLVMHDVKANIEKLRALRELGLGVAIDDFGTGYSSLAYLTKLPATSLKIDRSFIQSMLSDPNVMLLVSTIVSLGRSLNLKVVAEGVETEEQADALRELACEEMQGYLYSKPLSSEALVALLPSS
jgi:diguanylate cyclase (GGDEF)-like protein/PAS domain S-box-containing protein